MAKFFHMQRSFNLKWTISTQIANLLITPRFQTSPKCRDWSALHWRRDSSSLRRRWQGKDRQEKPTVSQLSAIFPHPNLFQNSIKELFRPIESDRVGQDHHWAMSADRVGTSTRRGASHLLFAEKDSQQAR
jgi:hypothetical protein